MNYEKLKKLKNYEDYTEAELFMEYSKKNGLFNLILILETLIIIMGLFSFNISIAVCTLAIILFQLPLIISILSELKEIKNEIQNNNSDQYYDMDLDNSQDIFDNDESETKGRL